MCTACKVAVPYQHIDTHLRDGHIFRAALRRKIAAQFDGLPAVQSIADLKPSADGSAPLPYLAAPSISYCRLNCSVFKTVNWDCIRRHAKNEHGINAVDCRKQKSEMSCALQSWRKYSRAYWIVDKLDQPAPIHPAMYAGSQLLQTRPNNRRKPCYCWRWRRSSV